MSVRISTQTVYIILPTLLECKINRRKKPGISSVKNFANFSQIHEICENFYPRKTIFLRYSVVFGAEFFFRKSRGAKLITFSIKLCFPKSIPNTSSSFT